MNSVKKLSFLAIICVWGLLIPSFAGATLITGSGTGTEGATLSSSADFSFGTHDFGLGSVNAIQIILTNTSTTTSYRANLLTGFFWSFSTDGLFTTTSAGFDGLATTVRTSNTTSTSNVDIAPAVRDSDIYSLNNFYAQGDKTDNLSPAQGGPRDWSAYEYAIATVAYGLGGFNGNLVGGDNYGIAAAGSNLTLDGLPTALPVIDSFATFWIAAPAGMTSLPEITNFAFAYGSLPDNKLSVPIPEPVSMLLMGAGLMTWGALHRRSGKRRQKRAQ